MKKLLVVCLTLLMACIPFTLTGCSLFEDVVDNAFIIEENKELKEENAALKKELANLKFSIAFPDGIIDEDCILNTVDRSVEGEGDALQIIGSAEVTINGGTFDGGKTPLGGAGNTAIWCNSEDAKVIINGGTFIIDGLTEGDAGHIDLIYCTAGIIEINGGVFMGADDTVWLLNCKDANYQEGKAQITVKGGTFINWNPADCISEGEHTNFVAEGYAVVSEIVNEGTDEEYTLYQVMLASEVPVEPEIPEEPGEF